MTSTAPQPHRLDPLAAFLSFLLPGLGQVLQGRIGKGLLFFFCIYALFFYGMWMGRMKNVWLPDTRKMPDVELPLVGKLDGLPKSVYYRMQYLGQFWVGVAAWPALVQFVASEPLGDPKDRNGFDVPLPADPDKLKPIAVLGHYMQAPSEPELGALQRADDKRWDLGWVYTVIAGVLNVLVIYDAFAGPVIRDDLDPATKNPKTTTPVGAPPDPKILTPVAVLPVVVVNGRQL